MKKINWSKRDYSLKEFAQIIVKRKALNKRVMNRDKSKNIVTADFKPCFFCSVGMKPFDCYYRNRMELEHVFYRMPGKGMVTLSFKGEDFDTCPNCHKFYMENYL